MSYDWQRSRDMPDFTRSGNEPATGGGRMFWLLVVVLVLGGLVLASAFSYGPTPVDHPGVSETAPAAETGSAGTSASGG